MKRFSNSIRINYLSFRKKTTSLLLAMFVSLMAFADSNQALIEMANKQYSDGDFTAAIANFEKVIETGYESASVYYNLGNAMYKNGELASAILYYEKAKLLAPNNEDINFNLELVNNHVVDKLDIIPEFFLNQWINSISLFFLPNQWAIASMLAFGLALLFFLFYLYNRLPLVRRLCFYLSMILLIATISSFIFSSKESKKLSVRDTAIIFSSSVTVKSSPDEGGTDLFLLHEGSKVSLIDSLGNWVEISLSDGNEGWISREALRVI